MKIRRDGDVAAGALGAVDVAFADVQVRHLAVIHPHAERREGIEDRLRQVVRVRLANVGERGVRRQRAVLAVVALNFYFARAK